MSENISIPTSISHRESYKRKYNLIDMYHIFVRVPDALNRFLKNKKTKVVDSQFVERLQLAVTEVNGCAVCSYAHTQMALKQGMSNEEIFSFLSGDKKYIKPEESKAILFAQHFADTGGYPTRQSYEAIINEYGKEKAEIMLAAVQIMMTGNVYGIPQSAFKSRLKGKPYQDSSLFYELGMQIFGILILPFALIHGWIKKTLGISIQKFA